MSRRECDEPLCTTTLPHHTHSDADGRSWCCGPYPYTAPRPESGGQQQAAANGRRLAWFTDDELLAEVTRRGLVESARPGQELREKVERLAKQYERLADELHLVPVADAFHDAALDLRRALDSSDVHLGPRAQGRPR